MGLRTGWDVAAAGALPALQPHVRGAQRRPACGCARAERRAGGKDGNGNGFLHPRHAAGHARPHPPVLADAAARAGTAPRILVLPRAAAAGRTPRPARYVLPHGVFTRLQVKAARESIHVRRRTLHVAGVGGPGLGTQHFELRVAHRHHGISSSPARLPPPRAVVALLKEMLDEVLRNDYPQLTSVAGVRTKPFAPLVDIIAEAQRLLEARRAGDETITIDGVEHKVADFAAWVNDIEGQNADCDIFLSFRSCDAKFAGRLADCLRRHVLTKTGEQVRVYPSDVLDTIERTRGMARARVFSPIVCRTRRWASALSNRRGGSRRAKLASAGADADADAGGAGAELAAARPCRWRASTRRTQCCWSVDIALLACCLPEDVQLAIPGRRRRRWRRRRRRGGGAACRSTSTGGEA